MKIEEFLKLVPMKFEFQRMPGFMPQKDMFGWFVAFSLAGKAPFVTKFYKGKYHVAKPSVCGGEWIPLTPKEYQRWEMCEKGKILPYDFVTRHAKPIPPNAVEVLNCLILDCISGAYEDWREFQNEFGYRDTQKAKKTYNKCRKIRRELRELLGYYNFGNLMSCETE